MNDIIVLAIGICMALAVGSAIGVRIGKRWAVRTIDNWWEDAPEVRKLLSSVPERDGSETPQLLKELVK